MIRLFHLLPLLALSFASCDKAKDFAARAKSAAGEKFSGAASSEAAGKPDPALQALVDESPEGFVFRKDLPFPAMLEVRITTETRLNQVRLVENSAMGNRSSVTDGKIQQVARLERAGEAVRISVESVARSRPDPEDPKKEVMEKSAEGLSGASVEFQRASGKWKARKAGDFKAVVWSKDIEPVLPAVLAQHGALPRGQWFGKHRLKAGDDVTLTGPTLSLLFGEGAKGDVKMTFEGAEAVAGHPCGVFSLSGDYSRRAAVSMDGETADEEVTIQSGKVWLSLLYPLVLREELETVQTRATGRKGGPSARLQGSVGISILREWRAGKQP